MKVRIRFVEMSGGQKVSMDLTALAPRQHMIRARFLQLLRLLQQRLHMSLFIIICNSFFRIHSMQSDAHPRTVAIPNAIAKHSIAETKPSHPVPNWFPDLTSSRSLSLRRTTRQWPRLCPLQRLHQPQLPDAWQALPPLVSASLPVGCGLQPSV